MKDSDTSFSVGFQTKVTETYDDFIFQQMSPFLNSVTEHRMSKQELVNALTKYRELEEENKYLGEMVARLKDIISFNSDVLTTMYYKDENDELEIAEIMDYTDNNKFVWVRHPCENKGIKIPVSDLIIVSDIERKYNREGKEIPLPY